MLFWDTKDESAWGLALVGAAIVIMAAILGVVTGNVQPTAPYEIEHTDVSAPMSHEQVPQGSTNPEASSPYHQPSIEKPSK